MPISPREIESLTTAPEAYTKTEAGSVRASRFGNTLYLYSPLTLYKFDKDGDYEPTTLAFDLADAIESLLVEGVVRNVIFGFKFLPDGEEEETTVATIAHKSEIPDEALLDRSEEHTFIATENGEHQALCYARPIGRNGETQAFVDVLGDLVRDKDTSAYPHSLDTVAGDTRTADEVRALSRGSAGLALGDEDTGAVGKAFYPERRLYFTLVAKKAAEAEAGLESVLRDEFLAEDFYEPVEIYVTTKASDVFVKAVAHRGTLSVTSSNGLNLGEYSIQHGDRDKVDIAKVVMRSLFFAIKYDGFRHTLINF